ncbi:protein snail homolog Sna-like [Limulus polyphemus]|uniref:Protein snail homolog Sna-like n=1 Tax=Limulus polyphemus TaxID=6850 RepID=A0ABM1BNY9_LIMPO|nr:protein snail homolog Sna-like [Limulus polyphemus]
MPRSFLIKKHQNYKANLPIKRSWTDMDNDIVISLASPLSLYSDDLVPFDLTKKTRVSGSKIEYQPQSVEEPLQHRRDPNVFAFSASSAETVVSRPEESSCTQTPVSHYQHFHSDTTYSFGYMEQPQIPMSPPRSPPTSCNGLARSTDKPILGSPVSTKELFSPIKSFPIQAVAPSKSELSTTWIPYSHQESLLTAPPSPESEEESSRDSTATISKTLTANSRYQCLECDKSYSTLSGLSKHRQFHCESTTKKSFSCKHCDKVYVSLGALKMHIRTHTLPCTCTLCGKAFSRPWLLQGHIRTHTGEKPFSCPHCTRAFADRSNLRAHLQTHSDVKKYRCKACNKTFSRMSLLVKHEEGVCASGLQQR